MDRTHEVGSSRGTTRGTSLAAARSRLLLAVALGGLTCAGVAAGCAAASSAPPNGNGGGSSGGAANGGNNQGGLGGGFDEDAGDGGLDPDAACAKFTAEAKQAPAAMLVVLDKSASMTTQNKWGTAQLSVVSAIDRDVFDTMSLGLTTFPHSFVDPPQCLCDYICAPLGGCDIQTCKAVIGGGVSCGVSLLPQVPLAFAGPEKSNASSGVRHDIYQYLVGNSPLSNSDDGSPIYDALDGAYQAIKLFQGVDKRIVVLVTDGGFSCTSLSNRPGYSDGACLDWEYPDSVNALIQAAHDDPSAPVSTFVVGLPGSDSTGDPQGSYATAPYDMKLALSTYAVSGAPESLDPACDASAVFTQNGVAPAVPCHLDLTTGGFDANKLAQAIADIRGKALGCVYDMPEPEPGEVIDQAQVNVELSIDAMAGVTLPKRTDPGDDCLTEGCWDYTSEGKIELLGKACTDVTDAIEAKVDILVGCQTITK
jgi:hypothetical protein